MQTYKKLMSNKLVEEHKARPSNLKKIVTNLFDKQNCVLHTNNLHLYTNFGLRVTNVHRAIEFSQRYWVKDYIAFNYFMRAQ